MKHLIATGALLFTVVATQAQDLKDVLSKTFWAFDTTMAMDVKVDQSNKLSRIAKKWDNEWITHYYAAFSKTVLSYLEKDAAKRDAYLDDADKELEDAVSILKKQTDETYVLAAMIANARLAVDGANRWMKYGKIFDDNLASAKELNPDNPRIYHLRGRSVFYTPKAFGGGKKNALPYFEKAEGLYAKETDNDIMKPSWGKRMNTYYLAQCRQEDKE